MDYLDQIWEKLKEWAQRITEAILGPEVQNQPELIPIPVEDGQRRQS